MGYDPNRLDQNVGKAKSFWDRVIRRGGKAPVLGSLPPEDEPSHGVTIETDERIQSETRIEGD